MGNKIKYLFVILFVVTTSLLAACTEPKIDTTNSQTLNSSFENVRRSLPKIKQEDFDSAVSIILFNCINLDNILSGILCETNNFIKSFKESIEGKTGLEIIQEANKIKAKQQKNEAPLCADQRPRLSIEEIRKMVAGDLMENDEKDR